MQKLLMLALLQSMLTCSVPVGPQGGPASDTRFLSPPAWIQGSWQNGFDAQTFSFVRFKFLDGDVVQITGGSRKSVAFSAKFKGCRVQEITGPERYALEIDRACGGETYEFMRVSARCGLAEDRFALEYSVRRGHEMIRYPSTSCQDLLLSEQRSDAPGNKGGHT